MINRDSDDYKAGRTDGIAIGRGLGYWLGARAGMRASLTDDERAEAIFQGDVAAEDFISGGGMDEFRSPYSKS